MTCGQQGSLFLSMSSDAFPASWFPLFSFLIFCYSNIFDKLERRFSNAKFTYFGNSKNPRVTGEQSCSSSIPSIPELESSLEGLENLKLTLVSLQPSPCWRDGDKRPAWKAKLRSGICCLQANDSRKNRYFKLCTLKWMLACLNCTVSK